MLCFVKNRVSEAQNLNVVKIKNIIKYEALLHIKKAVAPLNEPHKDELLVSVFDFSKLCWWGERGGAHSTWLRAGWLGV